MLYIKCNRLLQNWDRIFCRCVIQVSFCCSMFGNASSYWLCLGEVLVDGLDAIQESLRF